MGLSRRVDPHDMARKQIVNERRETIQLPVGPPVGDEEILSLDVTEFTEPIETRLRAHPASCLHQGCRREESFRAVAPRWQAARPASQA
jgi:hypothetical protein